MNSLYTPGPQNVPSEFTKPTKSFKKHVWLSVLALIAFISLYFFLTFWFGKLAYNLFRGQGSLLNYGLGAGFAFLSLFMAKSLFFLNKREENPMRRYVTEKEEPVLFDYLYKLADEARSPRPHKVFLTDRVNASVSYDLSFLNLLFPSKKNLEIGLGLVNVLSLGEFKAVLAHEYGHFAQRSMLLGRYVYTAQQIAARIVGKRDILDSFLAGISGFDIRIAWIGWILQILVWAIRSLIETCFSVVSIAERALSREMEFQADLVAVSMTGSDALIHALYKLQIADEAYDNALAVVNDQLGNKRAVPNMYALQTNYIKKMSWLQDDESYGKSPVVPTMNPGSNRIFVSRNYNPPKMWATHPADKDREANAKKIYIPATIDHRSTKELLSNADSYETDMTATLIGTAKVDTTPISLETSITAQNKEYFDWSFLNPKYHASFLNRYAFMDYDKVDSLYNATLDEVDLKAIFSELYPENLKVSLHQLKEVNEEIEALIISENEVVTAEKRRIWHRGSEIKRSDIPEVIANLRKEKEKLIAHMKTHDVKCRKAHYEAASTFDQGWPEYLKSLAGLVHYSEHSISNINDSARKFHNVLNVVLADGRVSSSELQDVLNASDDYWSVVQKAFADSTKIKLDVMLLQKMQLTSYKDAFKKFTLTEPNKEVINEWIQVIDGWANSALQHLQKLRNVSLEQLLDMEDEIRTNFLAGNKMTRTAPNTLELVKDYDLLLPGTERSIQRKLNFRDRFFQGNGIIASSAKFGVSGAILLGALFLGSYSQKSSLFIFNGLQTSVKVTVDGSTYTIDANTHEEVNINLDATYPIVARTLDGEHIESLETAFDDPSKKYIYNIANAGAFIQYPVFYGYEGNATDEYLGTVKWIGTVADHVLKEAPETISTSSRNSRERRDVVQGYSNIDPYNIIGIVEDSLQVQRLIRSHALWDDTNSPYLMTWLRLLGSGPGSMKVLRKRLEKNQNEIYALRALQDNADSLERLEICAEHHQLAASEPKNADYRYLTIRCIEDEAQQNKAFIEWHERFPQHPWLAFASAYSYSKIGNWQKSHNAFQVASANNESLRASIGLDAERIRRVLERKLKIDVPLSERIHNPDIEAYNRMESGQLDGQYGDSNHVYYLISEGKFEQALTYIASYEDIKPRVLRFLAASEGVNREIVESALELPTDVGIDYDAIWVALGVAVRENAATTDYIKSASLMGFDQRKITDFIRLVKQGSTLEAEELLLNLDFRFKSQYYLLGSIILGEKAPGDWKIYTNSMLFANERPFIKMD